MKKLIVMLLLLLLWTVPTRSVFAHTYLQQALPSQNEVVTEPISELQLTFTTKIENGSTFELENNTTGVRINPTTISIETKLMKGTLPQSIENGDYRVNWKVIGADGHIIQGEYTFMVAVPKNSDEQSITKGNQNKEVEPEKSATNLKQNKTDNEKSADNLSHPENKQTTVENYKQGFSPILIIISSLGAFLVVGLLYRFMKGS
jgi:copper resistance protein C